MQAQLMEQSKRLLEQIACLTYLASPSLGEGQLSLYHLRKRQFGEEPLAARHCLRPAQTSSCFCPGGLEGEKFTKNPVNQHIQK